jgi:hypothetical protein
MSLPFPTEDAPAGQHHGWFSTKQSQFGTTFYKKEDGTEVEVTEVTDTKVWSSNWDDVVYVGLVMDRGSRKGRPAEHVFDRFMDNHKDICDEIKYRHPSRNKYS